MKLHHYEGQTAGKVYDWQLIKRLSKYLSPYKYYILLSIVLLFLVSLLGLIGPYLTKIAIDEYIPHKNIAGLNRLALIFIGILLLQFAIRYAHIQLMQYTGQSVMLDLRMRLFERLQHMSLSFFDSQSVGGIMSRLISDIEVLNEMVSSGIVSIMGDLFMLLGIMSVLMWMNLKLALVVFSVIPLIFYVTLSFRHKVRTSFRQIRRYIAKINTYLQENISGMSIVQAFCREEKNLSEFKKINADYLNSYLKTILYYAVFFPIIEVISALALALIIWYGGAQIVQGTLSFGILVAFIEYAQRFFRPINDLSEKYNILQSAMAAAERVFNLLDTDTGFISADNPKSIDNFAKQIEFKNVCFAYKKDEQVLKDISFKVDKGQKVALVGFTGSGKTSIINLLMRFYELKTGSILIDGHDIRNINIQSWRNRISLVLQEPFLFSGTILDNIRLGDENISEMQAQDAAVRVNAHQFIEQLPLKYLEPIEEGGANLSVGQRQLIAFARALAFNPEALILDEATSNVDSHTEALIEDAVEKLMQGRTAIIIAHRLSTIQNVDKIIVLDKGKIAEEGSHEELLVKGGIYSCLYELQFNGNLQECR